MTAASKTLCPTCSGPTRETVGMVCQTCGTDYAAADRMAQIHQRAQTSVDRPCDEDCPSHGCQLERDVRYLIARLAEQATEIRHLESDERIAAWHAVTAHPVFASCYDEDGTLIDAVMRRLDLLAEQAATIEAHRDAIVPEDFSGGPAYVAGVRYGMTMAASLVRGES